jgi:DNA-binding transcriptional MerR regulator
LSTTSAVLTLKLALCLLKLEKDSITLQEDAKKLIHLQQKARALLVLKLKRFKENEVTKVEGELMSVLEMIETVEWEHTNMEVLKALKAGNNTLKKLHDEMSLDDVAELLEETNDAIEVRTLFFHRVCFTSFLICCATFIQMENQINLMLAGQFNTEDNAELEKELAELMGETVVAPPQAQETAKQKEQPLAASLPAPPSHTIEVTKQESEPNALKEVPPQRQAALTS